MRTTRIYADYGAIVWRACAVMLAAVACGGGCRPAAEPRQEAQTCHADDGCSERPGGHAHEAAPGGSDAASIDERAAAPCECGVPVYQCDECRYEAGVVKLDAALLNREEGGLVRTQCVERVRLPGLLAATGELALNEGQTVRVGPRIGGSVAAVFVDVGQRVRPGDPLFELSSVELGRALAQHERSRTLAELSEQALGRERRLRDRNVVSEQAVAEAQLAFEQHRIDLHAAEQELRVLGLSDEEVDALRAPAPRAAPDRLSVRAPIAGTVVARQVVAGELVEAGTERILLSDLTTLWAWIDVHARDLGRLLEAAERGSVGVAVTVDAFPGQRFDGKVEHVGATMDERTRTVKVRVAVANPDGRLRPGMFCKATLALDEGPMAEAVASVPRSAVLSDEGRSFAFRHWKEDYYVRQDVRPGREGLGRVEIAAGLEPGDVVVTEGAFLLKSDVLREKMGAGCAD